MKKEIPDEIMDIFLESRAYSDLRDKYINKKFGFKKARKCAIKAVQLKAKFWQSIRELYPDQVKKYNTVAYNPMEGNIEFTDLKK